MNRDVIASTCVEPDLVKATTLIRLLLIALRVALLVALLVAAANVTAETIASKSVETAAISIKSAVSACMRDGIAMRFAISSAIACRIYYLRKDQLFRFRLMGTC